MAKTTTTLGLIGAVAVAAFVGHGVRSWYFETPKDRAPVAAPQETASAATPAVSAAETTVPVPIAPKLALPAAPEMNAAETELVRRIHAKFATGDFASALTLADQSAAREDLTASFHEWLRQQLPVLLASAGWSKLRLGDCEEATPLFRRAESLKRSKETAKGLAVCYYKQKNIIGAQEQFSWYLERESGDLEMQVLYADVLESEGRYDDAVKMLELAAAQDAKLEGVKQRLQSMRARAKEAPLQQYETSRNFRLLYRSGDHEDLVNNVLENLEIALDEYVETYGLKPPPAPIEVILYPAAQFKGIVVGGPDWAEGIFDGRLRIPIRETTLRNPDAKLLREVLRHELVHALFSLASDARQLPPWFDEGMAQRLACASPACGPFVFPATPGSFLGSPSFFAPYISLDAARAGRAYRQSLYLIFAIERLYGEDALRTLSQSISMTSEPSSDGILKPLGTTFDELQKKAAVMWANRTVLGIPPSR